MIEFLKDGDIFDSKYEGIVNPVNCVGVMGGGLALAFKHRFPQNFIDYRMDCEAGFLKIGKPTAFWEHNQCVINFPTKDHYRNDSKYEYIELGMQGLFDLIDNNFLTVDNIAIPALGCGLGGLDWLRVKEIIEETIGGYENKDEIDWYVFEPKE